MSFFKKLFNTPKEKKTKASSENLENLSLDQSFVQKFLANQGKFLYCTTLEEVTLNLAQIVEENQWEDLICNDLDLLKLVKTIGINTTEKFSNSLPLFVGCEHLIAENGSILFPRTN